MNMGSAFSTVRFRRGKKAIADRQNIATRKLTIRWK